VTARANTTKRTKTGVVLRNEFFESPSIERLGYIRRTEKDFIEDRATPSKIDIDK
jgi:hypothetical protein